ncbi:MAG: HNH endonuclease [Actinomycetota bacterium]|nr:HNH endonuclease [Actinomycetota bacterium]
MTNTITRWWSKVEKTDDCWHWKGTIVQRPGGLPYGQFKESGRRHRAHRFAYELLVGPIPAGLVIDHLCRNTLCVNPEHLEPVTDAVNIARGVSPGAVAARQGACEAGHPHSEENTRIQGGRRHCRACQRESRRRYVARKKAA